MTNTNEKIANAFANVIAGSFILGIGICVFILGLVLIPVVIGIPIAICGFMLMLSGIGWMVGKRWNPADLMKKNQPPINT